jgi:hypothetical protein
MPITLPSTDPLNWSAEIVPKPAESASAFGTNRQRFVRLGRHWRFSVTLPLLTQEQALSWSVLDSDTDTMVWSIPQGGLQAAGEGTPRVAGASQLGTTLDVDGLTVGYVVKQGAFISVTTSSRRYVYQVTAQATADGTGAAALSIQPPLRVSPADNDVVEIAAPKVEGLASRQPVSFGVLHRVSGLSFTIEERG